MDWHDLPKIFPEISASEGWLALLQRHAALLDTASAKADQIMQNAPFGVSLTKEGMWSALEIPGMQAAIDLENRQQIMATATADHREAMAASRERRPPRFTNS